MKEKMTTNCIKELNELRLNHIFTDLSLEQHIYECLKNIQWDKKEIVRIIDEVIKDKHLILKMDNDQKKK